MLLDESECCNWWDEQQAIPAEQDAKSVGSTIRIQDEPCRGAEAAGSPTASDALTIHSEVELAPNAATTLRVSGDLIGDRQPATIGARTAAQANEGETGRGPVKNRHWKLQQRSNRHIRMHVGMALTIRKERRCWRCCRGAPTTVSRYRRHLERFLRWADDEGRVLRGDDAVDSALVEFLSHPFSPGTAGVGRRTATCSFALLLAGVRPLLREEDPSLMAVCHRMATCDSRKKPQTAFDLAGQSSPCELEKGHPEGHCGHCGSRVRLRLRLRESPKRPPLLMSEPMGGS